MTLPKRVSPKGKPVSLFVTCMINMVNPETGWSVIKILESLNIQVNYPINQTCCGQPGFNGGYRDEAKSVAIKFLEAFEDAEVIVIPSGSCAAMIRHEYQTLFADDPLMLKKAEEISKKTWEFAEYIVEGLGIQNLGLIYDEPETVAFHDACHGLRLLNLGKANRTLLQNTKNISISEMDNHETCCGFGGLFSVKMSDVSGAMLDNKIVDIQSSTAKTLLSGDFGCMIHMNGGLAKQGKKERIQHFADFIAKGMPK